MFWWIVSETKNPKTLVKRGWDNNHLCKISQRTNKVMFFTSHVSGLMCKKIRGIGGMWPLMVPPNAITKNSDCNSIHVWTGWWLNQPIWKLLVKLEIFPKDRGEQKKYLSCHHLETTFNKIINSDFLRWSHLPVPWILVEPFRMERCWHLSTVSKNNTYPGCLAIAQLLQLKANW